MGLKRMFFDLDESVIGAMPDFSLQMLPFLLVSFKQSILRIRALTVCKERFVFFFHRKRLKKQSEGRPLYIDDFGMARKGKSGMATNCTA